MPFTPVQLIGIQRSGSNLLPLMLKQLEEVSAPHPPHIPERFFSLHPAYNVPTNPEDFAQLVEKACKLIKFNPVPWSGLNLDTSAIIPRCRQLLLTEIFIVIYEMRAESENVWIWIYECGVNMLKE
jgi:hypothetical protein